MRLHRWDDLMFNSKVGKHCIIFKRKIGCRCYYFFLRFVVEENINVCLETCLKLVALKEKKKIDRNHLLNVIYFSRTDGFEHEEHETASES